MAAMTSPPPGPYADNLPTPPASSIAPSNHPNPLPQPRRHPLKPGSPKEAQVIAFLDNGINKVKKNVSNRIHKQTTLDGDEKGYRTFREAAKDLDGLVDVIWVSSSPNLQIPYFINIAALINDSLLQFPPAPRETFRLLDKLDFAFYSLLTGRDPDTNEFLPGFQNGRKVSTTDKIRIKCVVERSRLVVVRMIEGEEGDDTMMNVDGDDDNDAEEKGMVHFEGFEHNEEEDDWEERHIAGVYERTLGELGNLLGGPPVGMISDDCEDKMMSDELMILNDE